MSPGRPAGKPASAKAAKPVPSASVPRPPRQIPLTPMRRETAKQIRKLAASVQESHPDMTVHQHLRDAARTLESGNEEGATRHLRAAMFALTPQSLMRNGLHTDDAHQAGRAAMHSVHRHLLLVKDIADAGARNQAATAKAAEPPAPQPAPDLNAQKPDGGGQAPARPGGGQDLNVAEPQLKMSRQFTTWDEVAGAVIDLAGPHGYEHGWKYVGGPGLPSAAGRQSGTGILSGPHPADRLTVAANPHVTAKVMSDADLQRADVELSRRATLLGKAGQKSRAHKAAVAEMQRRAGTGLASRQDDPATAIELVGPHGYSHGWVKDGESSSALDPAVRSANAARAKGSAVKGGHYETGHSVADALTQATRTGKTHYVVPTSVGMQVSARENPIGGHIRVDPSGEVSQWDYQRGEHRKATVMPDHAVRSLLDRHLSKTKAPPPRSAAAGPAARKRKDIARAVKDLQANPELRTPELLRKLRSIAENSGSLDLIPAEWGLAYGWGDLLTLIDLSAKTAALEATPAPRGKPGGPGLYHQKGNAHSPYLEQIVKALIEKRGMPPGKAYAIAWGAMRKWAAGGGKVHPEVRAAAAGGLGLEKAAAARAHANEPGGVELTGPGGWSHGWIKAGDAISATADSIDNDQRAGFRAGRVKSNLSNAAAAARSGDHRAALEHLARAKKDATGESARVRVPQVVTQGGGTVAGLIDKHVTQIEAARLKAARAARISAHAHASTWDDLAGVLEMAITRVPAGQGGGGQFGSGSGAPVAGPTPAQKAAQKAALLATAKNDRAQAAQLGQQRSMLRRALASAGGKVSKGQAGSKTAKKKAVTPATPAAAAAKAKATAAAKAKAAAGVKAPGSAARAAKVMQLKGQIASLNTQINGLLAAANAATAQAAKL